MDALVVPTTGKGVTSRRIARAGGWHFEQISRRWTYRALSQVAWGTVDGTVGECTGCYKDHR